MKKSDKFPGSSFIIELQIYPVDVFVSIGEEDEFMFEELIYLGVDENEVHNAEYDGIGDARYCLFESGQSLIRIKKKPETPKEYGSLQHEIFHCAASILWRVGIKLEIMVSDEAYAYLVQYLTENIYEKMAE